MTVRTTPAPQRRPMLLGMDAIEDYVGRDEATIREWVESENFPAIKTKGRWESHPDLIDAWRINRIAIATGNAVN